MALLNHIKTYSAKQFTWQGKVGCAEMSDLTSSTLTSPLYDDSADQGFYIDSPKSGKRVLFYYESTITSNGDVVGWTFQSLADVELKVTVWND